MSNQFWWPEQLDLRPLRQHAAESFAFGFIWVRWTLPSFRYDQLMRLGWKNMMPLALANVAVTGIVLLFAGPGGR